MEWIVKIVGEENKGKQIRIKYQPIRKRICFYGEYKINGKTNVFSYRIHNDIQITLEQIQKEFEIVLIDMNEKIKEFKNLDKGFSVLKWVGLKEED